jgi:putative transposase
MSLNPVVAPDAALPAAVLTCSCGCIDRPRRYPTDLTEAQWAVLAPLLPAPAWQSRTGGRPEKHHRRAILDAIFYLVDNGVKWRALPADFPPWRTVYGFFARWCADLSTIELTDRLRAALRRAEKRRPTPSAGCIDAQSVAETAEGTVPVATSGFDPHKRVNGRKRHILVDTLGLLVAVVITAANVQDRDAARPLLDEAALRGMRHIWADSGYQGDVIAWALAILTVTIEIVPRVAGVKGFQPLPRRWVVERSFAWITRRRRCARDYERLTDHHETTVYWAAILTMTRRLARRVYHEPANQVQKQAL